MDSSRLLIEAEPPKKPLENRGHGLDQVKSWLSQREFESDFGFATDGLRWIFVRYDPDSYTHNIIEGVDLRPVFLTLFDNATGANRPPTEVVTEDERELVATLLRTFQYENFVSIIDDAREVIKEKQEEITDEFYDDYTCVVFGVQEDTDDRRARSLIDDGIVPPEETDDGLATFERCSEDSVRSRYEDVIEQTELHEEFSAFPEKANELLAEYREELDEDILDDFRDVSEEYDQVRAGVQL
ncbi:hypothetical protein [Halobellus inordinatus]|uniref:hypothetical protein n=1 Tax=Halobellus inordinatus TaxID=1126236 RepID=UPI00210CA289|nr:hypothetical protein [Halobellus inordinatus]